MMMMMIDKRKKDMYFGVDENLFLGQYMFQLKFAYIEGILFKIKYKNKNKRKYVKHAS